MSLGVYINIFECLKCGNCCKNVVFHIQERKIAIRHAGYEGIDPKIIARFRHSLEYRSFSNKQDYYFLKGKCPFFDRGKGCLIYLSRPFNCRNFMCGRENESEILEWDGQACLNQTRRLEKDAGYKEYVEKEINKSKNYARSIGIL